MRKRLAALTIITVLAAVAVPQDAAAKWRIFGKKKTETTAQADTTKKETKYDKLFKGETTRAEGLMTLHLVKGKVYFEMPESLLGREFVMGSTVKSISDNGNALVGSKPALKHFCFTRQDSTVFMREIVTDYMAADAGIEAALAQSTVGPIIKKLKIAAQSPDSSAVVFDMTDVFLDHDKSMSPFLNESIYGSYTRNENFKKDLSYIEGVKAFEDNISVTSCMSYTFTMTDVNGKTICKDRPFTAELVRSILLLPEEVYHPRMADYRIGVFFTGREQFASTSSTSKDIYFANRWRLEPSDTAAYRAGQLVEPVKPIVFYIDSNFPSWWKPYIHEAVEQWNEPFELIGFKNAVIARDFPTDDPEFDPDNIKYSCLRYEPVNIQNAMGPSWVDPRSGEIINASVYVYHDIIKLLTRWMFIQTAQADPDVRAAELPREILGDGIRYVISHEVGHCLGLMHNMSASSVIPVEDLRSPEATAKTGTTTSIMDYARFNYVAQPGDKERGVKLTPPRFGAYDKWAIRWAYQPVFDVESFEEEAAITSSWITDSLKADAFYRYGKQQMSSSFFDPRSQTEDLGDDSIAATKYGVANLKYIISNFMDWVADDEDYDFRVAVYEGILNQYIMYAQHVALNVGGLYKNEVKEADEMPRFANVPAAKQKEALEYLFELWDDCEWLGDKEVVSKLPLVGLPVDAVRNAIQNLILYTPMFAGASDGVATYEFSRNECLDFIYDRAFKPTKQHRPLTKADRVLQKAFVNSVIATAGLPNMAAASTGAAQLTEGSRVVCHEHLGCCAEGEFEPFGNLVYNPVGGYEWMPRYIFNMQYADPAGLYSLLDRMRTLLKSAKASGSAEDKAHYEMLLQTINFSIR